MYSLLNGNNLELLDRLKENSMDAVITDGPYGISFMNKKWDYDVPSVDFWKKVYRVLKPGGHILSFGGTRTYHRMVVNLEDGGFEIRDCISWIYGSGFPKSLNIGKSADEWNGWGTSLKPSQELICLARKPLSEPTIVENVLKWGTGGMNIDGCRIGSEIISIHNAPKGTFAGGEENRGSDTSSYRDSEGRFPANTILECICDEVIKGEKGQASKSGYREGGKSENSVGLNGVKYAPDNYNDKGDIHTNSECPCRLVDNQSGVSSSQKRNNFKRDNSIWQENTGDTNTMNGGFTDKGGAGRFFYQAKVSKSERNMGLDGKNGHPTCKPINLLTYLCRLITPPNGTILDPYMGSGSTGIAAQLEGFNFIGMELQEDYFKIAEARIENWEKYKTLLKK